MSVLADTFGNDWSCVARFVKKNEGRPHALIVYFKNGPCLNNRRCEIQDNSSTQLVVWEKASSVVSQNTTVFLSPILEDRKSTAWIRNRMRILSQLCPSCYLLRNPVDENARILPGWIAEYHGLFPKRTKGAIISNDGVGVSLSNVTEFRKRNSRAKGIYLWTADSQGIANGWYPPSKRSFEITARSVNIWKNFLGDDYGRKIK